MQINLEKINKIHFIGIGGIGLSAIAKLMKEKGKYICGSDLNHSLIIENLEKSGIVIYTMQSKDNIDSSIELVIHSMAVPEDNPELKRAKELNIKTITYPESLSLIFNNKFGIAICGTHGKSSTTAMAGLLFDDAKLDPSIVVGSILPKYKSNLRIGKSKYFLIEACEYKRAFLNYYPKIILLNNIELDHTDYYKDLDDFKSAFEEFITHLSIDGMLILNGDDENVLSIKNKISKILSFGLNEKNDVRAINVEFMDGQTKFEVFYRNKNIGEFVLKVPGLFNIYNALGAISLGLTLKIPIEKIKKSLKNYSGIWRRFEIKGEYKNALVISDYAHHPTEVKATIKATKKFYPEKRIMTVFQPHQHNRTKKLYQYFLKSFDDTDILILSEIFDVEGREEKEDQSVSSLDLVNDIKKENKNISKNIFYTKNLEETKKLIDEKIKPDDILLIMGAGDIYKVADELTN
ncbi:MAG: UDP-N-acetylmuramate--L-alanine ligase [Patescibacteria group bacterium]|nr:UDP-N-acetylmuramate--L-alanine ligase [Patescibacteria group bacterium]